MAKFPDSVGRVRGEEGGPSSDGGRTAVRRCDEHGVVGVCNDLQVRLVGVVKGLCQDRGQATERAERVALRDAVDVCCEDAPATGGGCLNRVGWSAEPGILACS